MRTVTDCWLPSPESDQQAQMYTGYLNELWSVSFETQQWTLVGSYNSRRRSYTPPGGESSEWPHTRAQPTVWTTPDRHKTYLFGGLTTTSGACAYSQTAYLPACLCGDDACFGI